MFPGLIQCLLCLCCILGFWKNCFEKACTFTTRGIQMSVWPQVLYVGMYFKCPDILILCFYRNELHQHPAFSCVLKGQKSDLKHMETVKKNFKWQDVEVKNEILSFVLLDLTKKKWKILTFKKLEQSNIRFFFKLPVEQIYLLSPIQYRI